MQYRFLAPIAGAVFLACTSATPRDPADEMDGSPPTVDAGSRADRAPDPALALQPDGWDRDLRLPEPANVRRRPGVVEVDLEAKPVEREILPGGRTRVWTYNGMLPGPLLRVKAGERLIVNFTNSLPEETTIHWHGVRVPIEMDGVPHHSQGAVKPGQKFQYSFVAPDPGFYWYHPHVRSAAQVGDGLYGALLVEDPDEPKGLGDEVVVVLSDISLDPESRQLLSPDIGGDFGTLFGREGSPILVNGKVTPTLKARRGRRMRWRVVNTARSRYFHVVLPGHKFTRIGGDGHFLEAPIEENGIVLIPGERADVLVTPEGAPGQVLIAKWVPYERGYGSTFMRDPEDILKVQIVDGPPQANAPVPARLRTIAPLDTSKAKTVDIRLTRGTANGKLVFGINGKMGEMSDPIRARLGETQIWNVTNEVDFAHPFHLHGFFFQVLSWADAGNKPRPTPPREWKDTADVPTKGSMKLVVRFDDRPGTWMFHCHILDHADAGMMGRVELTP